MRSCGSLSDTRAREVDNVGAVGFIVSSNGGIGLAFLRAEYMRDDGVLPRVSQLGEWMSGA